MKQKTSTSESFSEIIYRKGCLWFFLQNLAEWPISQIFIPGYRIPEKSHPIATSDQAHGDITTNEVSTAVVAQNQVLPDLIDNTRHYDNVSSSMEVDEVSNSPQKEAMNHQGGRATPVEEGWDMATLQSHFGEKYFGTEHSEY